MQDELLFSISSFKGAYDVHIGPADLFFEKTEGHALVLIDSKVLDLHRSLFQKKFSEKSILAIDATEENKSWLGVESVIRFLVDSKANRKTKALVIGGGIIQDICAFACHVFFRGIQWDFYPTTLLAMADSCIGAKSGLNFDTTKNLVGVFENPTKVIIDPRFTATLTDSDFRSGLGEIAKLALISGENAVQMLNNALNDDIRSINVVPLIEMSLNTKKRFIEEDEFDFGIRRILNYGHTFGHALETVTRYAIPHGLAVVFGMDIVNFISKERGLMPLESFNRLHHLLTRHFDFSCQLNPDQREALWESVAKDKKRTETGMNFAMISEPGNYFLKNIPMDRDLKQQMELYFGTIAVE